MPCSIPPTGRIGSRCSRCSVASAGRWRPDDGTWTLYVSARPQRTRVLFPFTSATSIGRRRPAPASCFPCCTFRARIPRRVVDLGGAVLASFGIASARHVLPLFSTCNDYRASRTTSCCRFVRHATNPGESIGWRPSSTGRARPGLDHRRVSVFWDWKRGDRRTTILVPLFAHWTRPTYAGRSLRSSISKGVRRGRRGYPDGTWRLFVPLVRRCRPATGDLRWGSSWLFGKERIGRNHYLKISSSPSRPRKRPPCKRRGTASRDDRRGLTPCGVWRRTPGEWEPGAQG